MTIYSEPADPTALRVRHGVVLAGLGNGSDPAAAAASPVGDPSPRFMASGSGGTGFTAMGAVAADLAALLGWRLLALGNGTSPDQELTTLAALADAAAGPWLTALEADLGRPLADGSCWAQALGAWRQPVLLVIPSHQIETGLPAAGTALLRQWRVPLLGLLQWGAPWNGEERRLDGLPWLGWLGRQGQTSAEDVAEAQQALAAAVTLRHRVLSVD